MPDNKISWSKERLQYLIALIKQMFQEKEAGKGLSTNDFTAALLSKLNGIEASADVNTIETVKLNDAALTPDVNKAVNIPVMGAASSGASGTIGLVPAPPKAGTGKYLRGDGSWAIPDDTTYEVVTALVAGLMSPAMLTKLNGIAEGATANIGTITEILMNGASKGTSGQVDLGTVLTSHQDISGKANVNSPTFTGTPQAPTPTSGDNSTKVATTAFVAAAITAALSNITEVDFVFVQSLPASGTKGVFYFVPSASGETGNQFDEYIWNAASSSFEKIGSPVVDLSGYMKSSDYPLITEAEVDEIFDEIFNEE